MTLTQMKSRLFGLSPARRRFRDRPVKSLALSAGRKSSPIRLVGYFVGGFLLANLVLLTSDALFGRTVPMLLPSELPRHGVSAALEDNHASVSQDAEAAAESGTDGVAPRDAEAEMEALPAKPAIAEVCADAREKLISGLSLYYLQRSRRPNASAEEVLESAGASALLAGPGDPGSMPSGIPCAG